MLLDTRSNDYLGFATDLVSRETVFTPAGVRAGAGASRLVSGTLPEHLALEGALSAWLETEASLCFASAYAANTGVVAALAEPGDLILSDALNHASIIDGCRLSRAEVGVLPHLDLAALSNALLRASTEGRTAWFVTETYFGMDGDSPDLARVRHLCTAHGAGLIVDETHALGVFGPAGRGLCAASGVVPNLLIGGFGKAFGSQGGFAAGPRLLIDWLWNRARSFVYSTALSPLLAALATHGVARLRAAEPLRAHLRALERRFAGHLESAGIPAPALRHGPIFPLLLGTEARAIDAATALAQRGFLCQPIRPPTVPEGSSRLRINLRASMAEQQIDALALALSEIWPGRAASAGTSRRELRPQPSLPLVPDPSPPPGLGPLPSLPLAPLPPPPVSAQAPSAGATSESPPKTSGPRRAIPGAAADSSIAEQRPPTGTNPSLTATSASAATPAVAWIILGTGTGVGKTFVAHGLLQQLARRGRPALGLKPIETGFSPGGDSDAARLAAASFHVKQPEPHPLYAFREPVAPALAARRDGTAIDLPSVARWLQQVRASACPPTQPDVVIETAGGAFSPLSVHHTNLDLALALGPARWVLVAPDRLGVLHDVRACLLALRGAGRAPDYLVLSAPSAPDASTGTNAGELTAMEPDLPVVTLPRGDTSPLSILLLPPLIPPPIPRLPDHRPPA